MIMGIIPGIGGLTALALLIPLMFGMYASTAFILFTATLAGGNFAGSVTAILLNTPGQAPNAATLLDGYPMTQDGRGGEAIGASAAASAAGALLGALVLLLMIPLFLRISLLFGTAEIFWLGVWGVTAIAVVVRGDALYGLISALLGFIVVFHGQHYITGNYRWTYNITELQSGFDLVPILVGLFAIGEMIHLVTKGGTISDNAGEFDISGQKWAGVKSVYQNRGTFFRSSILGVLIGMIPGIGGTAANYIAYFQTVQASGNPDAFGKGDIRGVIASEASNDAKDGGAFLPTLALGVPGSAGMALILSAFVLHGITPGPLLFQNNLEIVFVIVMTLIIANILTSVIGYSVAEKLVSITRVDVYIIAPVVISIALYASYLVNNTLFGTYTALLFGLLGYLMITLNMSRVPMILAVVLGPIIENNFWRALRIPGGDLTIFVGSGLSIVLILLIIISLLSPYLNVKTIARGIQ
jgi:putative tricarboxylic transport membrane protein